MSDRSPWLPEAPSPAVVRLDGYDDVEVVLQSTIAWSDGDVVVDLGSRPLDAALVDVLVRSQRALHGTGRSLLVLDEHGRAGALIDVTIAGRSVDVREVRAATA